MVSGDLGEYKRQSRTDPDETRREIFNRSMYKSPHVNIEEEQRENQERKNYCHTTWAISFENWKTFTNVKFKMNIANDKRKAPL